MFLLQSFFLNLFFQSSQNLRHIIVRRGTCLSREKEILSQIFLPLFELKCSSVSMTHAKLRFTLTLSYVLSMEWPWSPDVIQIIGWLPIDPLVGNQFVLQLLKTALTAHCDSHTNG